MTPEELGKQVQDVAVMLGDYLAELGVPAEIGMAALALTLAASAKVQGMTPHETISRFTASVRSVHKDSHQWN